MQLKERLLRSFALLWNNKVLIEGENMENTIVAIATATGESGIGIVRLSGEKSIDIVKNFFKPYDKKEIDEKIQ